MIGFSGILWISLAIVAILLGRAIWVVRSEKDTPRGSSPGTGYHEINADYHSGAGGGGQTYRFHVPKDPQEYAKAFVPHNNRKKNK